MAFEETESKHPIEHIIMFFAFVIQEREHKLEYDELLFLRDSLLGEIKNRDRELH